MSRNTRSWVVLPLTTIFALVLTLLGGISAPASAGPGDPIIPPTPSCTVTLVSGDPEVAPPPSCFDPSGTDQDEYMAPIVPTDANGGIMGYYRDGTFLDMERIYTTGGAASFSVTSKYWDQASNSYVGGPSWILAFNTATTGIEAGEAYRAAVIPGTCNAQTSQWQVDWFVTNIADSSMRYIPQVEGSVFRLADDTLIPPGAYDTSLVAKRVFDGAEVSMGRESMSPGTYKFSAMIGQRYSGWQSWRLEVPSCGSVNGPDAENGGGSPETEVVIPVGKFRQVRPTKMKAIVDSRKVKYPVRIKVAIDPKIGKTTIKTFKVTAGSLKSRWYIAPAGTRFVMKARVRQLTDDDRYVLRWKVLKRATLRKR